MYIFFYLPSFFIVYSHASSSNSNNINNDNNETS